jgi:hypothetical protein
MDHAPFAWDSMSLPRENVTAATTNSLALVRDATRGFFDTPQQLPPPVREAVLTIIVCRVRTSTRRKDRIAIDRFREGSENQRGQYPDYLKCSL